MKVSNTNRGFHIIEFEDKYNAKCRLQKSSLATEDCIWLGVKDANPQIMKSDALKLGLPVERPIEGWTPFEVPEEVLLTTEMHLTREQVAELIPHLVQFVETGDIT